MKSANKELNRPAQSWIDRVERRRSPDVYYNSELRDWLQHVILEAEKSKDPKKRDQFRSLLKGLNAV
jgi:hypothetical protein